MLKIGDRIELKTLPINGNAGAFYAACYIINIGEKTLTVKYKRAKQDQIIEEITDVISRKDIVKIRKLV